MPKKPRPFVMIGAGGIVNDAHLPAYPKAGFKVAGIFHLDPNRAQRTAVAFEISRVYASLAEAVQSSPDDAILGTMASLHAMSKAAPAIWTLP